MSDIRSQLHIHGASEFQVRFDKFEAQEPHFYVVELNLNDTQTRVTIFLNDDDLEAFRDAISDLLTQMNEALYTPPISTLGVNDTPSIPAELENLIDRAEHKKSTLGKNCD